MFHKASRLLLVACLRYTTGVKMDDTPERCCPCTEPPFEYKQVFARIDMSYEDKQRVVTATTKENMFGYRGLEIMSMSNDLSDRLKLTSMSRENLFGYEGVASGLNIKDVSEEVGMTTGNNLLDPFKLNELRGMNAAGSESTFGHKGMEAILDNDAYRSKGLIRRRRKAKIAASIEGLFGYGGVATSQNVGDVSNGVGVTATGNDLLDPLKWDDLKAMNAASTESFFGHKAMEATLDKDCHLSSGLGWGKHKASESPIGDRGVTVRSLGNQDVSGQLIHRKRPKSFDWREHGAVTAVRDQKLCGCCYIISSVAATEALRKIKMGILEQFSIQQVIDCNLLRKNDGCFGGWAWLVFEYIILSGLTIEELYPFTSWNLDPTKKMQSKDKRYKKCTHGLKKVANICGWTTVIENPDSFESGVLINPFLVALRLNHFFTGYTGGIISLEDMPPPTTLELGYPKFELHAVLLVGYGEEETGKRFWILKNSHGAHWGQGGYFRLERDVSHPWGVGGLTRVPGIYPTGYIDVNPDPPTLWDACLEKLRKLSF